jgi:hypothetical protein
MSGPGQATGNSAEPLALCRVSYTLGDVSTTSGHDPAGDVRAWASTLIAAIRAIRGETSPEAITGAAAIEDVLRSARSLAIASGAVIDAMLIAARAGEPPHQAAGGRGGRPSTGALTLRELGDILGHTHGAVDQRIRKITSADYVAPPEDHWLRD